ncbi:hypothetical protein [Sporocytophaga myxococcoides]|nr:hypothetical protein [Sporocytophaga myxococcoides]
MFNRIIGCLLFVIMAACSAKKDKVIKPDQRSFLLVNLNQEFPVINFPLTFSNNDSLGLRCIECEQYPLGKKIKEVSSEIKRIYINSIYVSNENKNITFRTLGMGPSYSFNYDSNYRRSSENVISCGDWEISYSYKDSSDKIYQYSIVDDTKPNTTIFYLDSLGRVAAAEGLEYGDLFKSFFTKKVFYSGSGSIPDSIISHIKRREKINEKRKEIFYFTDNKVDSIRLEWESYSYSTGLITLVNRFDEQEMLVSRTILWPSGESESFVVEKISRKW